MHKRILPQFLFFFLLICFACGGKQDEAQSDSAVPTNPTLGNYMNVDPESPSITVIGNNYSFVPDSIIVLKGQRLGILFKNQSDHFHNIVFEMPSGEVRIPEHVPPGARDSINITVPDKEGVYRFYCPVAEHEDLGMTGKLVVVDSKNL